MNWIVKENVILGEENEEIIVPSVNDIFESRDTIRVNGSIENAILLILSGTHTLFC